MNEKHTHTHTHWGEASKSHPDGTVDYGKYWHM